MVARDLEIVEWTGARYHVAHVSTARTVALVRDAKRRGLPVTCEVTPHHLALTDEACSHYDTRTKVMPPLRTAADQEALLEALADGTIDCDRDRPRAALAGREGRRVRVRRARHARPRDRAADHPRLRAHGHARRPARDRGADRRPGARVRPARRRARGRRGRRPLRDRPRAAGDDRRAEGLASKSKNTPFLGQTLAGRAVLTLRRGPRGVTISTGGCDDRRAGRPRSCSRTARCSAARASARAIESIGEVVFNTSITGYQEIISDPSYCGQIVVMTAPQIGNVGVNPDGHRGAAGRVRRPRDPRAVADPGELARRGRRSPALARARARSPASTASTPAR